MSTKPDIVKGLRLMHDALGWTNGDPSTVSTAADEIEHLRAENADLRLAMDDTAASFFDRWPLHKEVARWRGLADQLAEALRRWEEAEPGDIIEWGIARLDDDEPRKHPALAAYEAAHKEGQ